MWHRGNTMTIQTLGQSAWCMPCVYSFFSLLGLLSLRDRPSSPLGHADLVLSGPSVPWPLQRSFADRIGLEGLDVAVRDAPHSSMTNKTFMQIKDVLLDIIW